MTSTVDSNAGGSVGSAKAQGDFLAACVCTTADESEDELRHLG